APHRSHGRALLRARRGPPAPVRPRGHGRPRHARGGVENRGNAAGEDDRARGSGPGAARRGGERVAGALPARLGAALPGVDGVPPTPPGPLRNGDEPHHRLAWRVAGAGARHAAPGAADLRRGDAPRRPRERGATTPGPRTGRRRHL
ncbi:MAG: hypothetical protein AVDCRST_MAG04-3499, partial [uncultured Acetobacteraceae bacterium]